MITAEIFVPFNTFRKFLESSIITCDLVAVIFEHCIRSLAILLISNANLLLPKHLFLSSRFRLQVKNEDYLFCKPER